MKSALIIFVRNPEPGKVKTRIAITMGNEKALEVYKELLLHTYHITKDISCDKFVFYADQITENDLWETSFYHKKLQQGNDLGQRMLLAFRELFGLGYQSIQIIGSDCMELTSDIIETGFNRLHENEVVIGPSADGGYYLLGMSLLIPDVFYKKEWSTEKVFSSTLADIKKLSLSYILLPELSDIDTEKDWLDHQTKIYQ